MKIAVSSRGPQLTSEVDPRFGRASYILVIDTETSEFEAVDNAVNAGAFKGAGIQAATMVNDKGAKVLMTGYCGPKAFQVLEAAGVKVVNDVSGTVSDAVDRFKSGKVDYSTSANAEAHW
ncbi:MAG: NifB/NifX family molybdenum-iron cluster-binding protein [Desulfocapsaceae bacterium]|nr:NifB/NifX family molybdenum-iron cluster-binding protein [Desulfocapsaceae bacterium]